MSKRVLYIVVIFLLLVAGAVFFLKKSIQVPEPVVETPKEQIEGDLKDYVVEPQNFQDPKVINETIVNYPIPDNKKASEQDVLDGLNSPDIILPTR